MKPNTPNFIVIKTLELIGQEGLPHITVRRIAKAAGVNVAAINYHFGSKEALIKEALALFSQRTDAVFSILHNEHLDLRTRIRELLFALADHIINYPGFIKTFIGTLAHGAEPPEVAALQIAEHRRQVLTLLKQLWDKPEEEIHIIVVQMFSAIIFPTVIGKKVETYYEIPYGDPLFRRDYLERLMARYGL